MPFPTNLGTNPQSLAEALRLVMRYAGSVKAAAQSIKAASLSGPIGANQVIDYVGELAEQRTTIAALAATTGLAAYAQGQYGDINTSYTAMVSAIDATRAWVIANFPKAASGEVLEKKLGADGRVQMNTFTTAQLAGFRTQLDALIATLD
jgi:hypothetical protein